MNRVVINGVVIQGGRSVVVSGNKILVDGVDVTPDAKVINIQVEGNVESLSVDACNQVTVTGNVGTARTVSGDLDIKGDVAGAVETVSGDVRCGNIGGSVRTVSGDIR